MSRYAQRLSRLARVFGCCVHSEILHCPRCEPPAPYPEPLAQEMSNLIDAIIARVPRESLRAAALRVPRPPVQELCGCGARLQCMRCQVRQTTLLLAAIGLMPDEQAWLDSMIDTCRQIDERR